MERDVQQESSAVGCGVGAHASSDNSLCTYFVKRDLYKLRGRTHKRDISTGVGCSVVARACLDNRLCYVLCQKRPIHMKRDVQKRHPNGS